MTSKTQITVRAILALSAISIGQTASAQDSLSCGLGNGEPAQGEPIRVGALVSQTGPDDFSSSADGARAFFECVNANGGINRRPIEYLVKDDQWNPEIARQMTVGLVEDDAVVAMIGSASFPDMAVNSAYYVEQGIMNIGGACPTSECFETPNSVPIEAGPLTSAVVAVQYAVENLGAENVICVTNALPNSGLWSCDWAVEYMTSRGLQGRTIGVDPASSDLNSITLEILASGSDTVLVHLPAGIGVPLLKTMEEQDLRDNFNWIASTPLFDDAIPAALGEYWWDNIYVSASKTSLDGTGPDMTLWRNVMDTYADPSDPRDSFSLGGFSAAKVFTRALLELDPETIDRATVTDAIRNITDYTSDTFCGTYYVGDFEQHTPLHQLTMNRLVEDGFEVVSECMDVDSTYLDPIREQEAELGITN